MKIHWYFIILIFFFGCGVPKDVYYSSHGTEPSQSVHSDRRPLSFGERKEDYYKRTSKDRSRDKSRKKSGRKSDRRGHKKNTASKKTPPGRRGDAPSRIYEEPERKPRSFMNYSPPMSIDRNDFVAQARKYIGVKYKWGGTSPQTGLDCSGFVMNVFNDFGVQAPRISRDLALYGREVPLEKARVGDLIFFTGRNHASGIIGHLGIIVRTSPRIEFIHSATSNNIGVIISEFKGYYEHHFVKVMSVLH